MTRVFRIELFFKGTRLLGQARVDRRSLTVEMIEPFPGVSARGNIMGLLSGLLRYLHAGELSSYGRQRAEELLVELFEQQQRAAQLRERFASRQEELTALILVAQEEVARQLAPLAPLDEATFCALRQALRRDLRQGLNPRIYQRRYQALRQRREVGHRAQQLVLEGVARRWPWKA